jgi:hypothetical protein
VPGIIIQRALPVVHGRQGIEDGGEDVVPRGVRGQRRKTSAADRWNPAGRPSAAMLAAISSISATQRHPFLAADRAAVSERPARAGWDRSHSASSVCSTPSARARARTARISAAVPLVQAA